MGTQWPKPFQKLNVHPEFFQRYLHSQPGSHGDRQSSKYKKNTALHTKSTQWASGIRAFFRLFPGAIPGRPREREEKPEANGGLCVGVNFRALSNDL